MLLAAAVPDTEEICGKDPRWICRELLDLTGSRQVAEIADWIAGPLLTIALTVLVALVAARLAGRAIDGAASGVASGGRRLRVLRRRAADEGIVRSPRESLRAEERTQALAGITRSAVSFVIFAVAAVSILGELGIDLAPLLAGAGVVGIALGFGSQKLVQDFLAGTFILVEDQFGVGDIVEIDTHRGTVERISLRTTQLRSVSGTVWHVPNGEIRIVGNRSKHWSRAVLDVEIAYEASIDDASEVIKQVADTAWHERDDIVEEPEVWGVENLGVTGVAIRLVLKTVPAQQNEVSRDLRRRIKDAFDREGIEMPAHQYATWAHGEDPEPPA